ncbi:MAG: hypothetical protein QXS54_11000 [Candidatus Methanomethylicaceae archaeon]
MNRTGMEKLLKIKLEELERVSREFSKDTVPSTPLPRLKNFRLSKEIAVYMESNTARLSINGLTFSPGCSLDTIAHVIVEHLGYKPRDVLRFVRRIEAVTNWFRRRTEGRKRMAGEILRQRKKYQETLQAEAALVSLSK